MSMCESFIKLNRGSRTTWLMGKYPWAYLLLNLIALRACRSLPNLDGLDIGEAQIGDWSAIGATRGQYRHALKILVKEGAIKILETNRNREKATTGTTTEGTKVKILNSDIWDINPETNNHRNDHFATTEQPRRRSKEDKKRKKEPHMSPSKINFREFVALTQAEHDKLLATHGPEFLTRMLDTLNAYKGSKGVEYLSDFHTMKQGGWVVEKVKKNLGNQQQNGQQCAQQNAKVLAALKEKYPDEKAWNVCYGSNYIEFTGGVHHVHVSCNEEAFLDKITPHLNRRNMELPSGF